MIGKSFQKVLCVVGIGVLHHLAVFGCQTNDDCHTQTEPQVKQQCCRKIFPPRCMDLVMCYTYVNDHTKLATTFYPRATNPDYNRFTDPDYNRFTDPVNDKFTDPDYNKFTLPDFKEFSRPHIDVPTFPYNDNNDEYSTNIPSNSTRTILVALVVLALVVLGIFIIGCRLHRSSPSRNNSQQNFNVQPPSATNSSQTSLVAQEDEEPSRIIMIAETRDEDHVSRQNRPPDGEPPFLSEEDILNNLHNIFAQEPPPYEETTSRSHLLSYDDSVNVEQPSHSVYPEVHTTCQSSLNSSQMIPPIQQHLTIPNVGPPSYEEAQAAGNQAINPLP